MEINKTAIDNLWTLVAATKKQILVIESFRDIRVYVVESFSPKTRDVFFNEVRGAQDITDFSIHLPFQMAELNLSHSKIDFKVDQKRILSLEVITICG